MSGTSAVVQNMSISLPRGATCLLIGPNGAGKTTLLKVLAGKHMVPRESVSVLGEPPFYATQLTASGALSYIGGNWERDIAFAGYSIPLAGDIPASQMLSSLPGIDPVRRERLIEALDIDPTWRMHLVSDGQRRRVQIAMGLLRPFELLLLDEVTVDLDVLGRADLMAFLKQECEERGATVVYATHIFDGLEAWPSHLMYVAGGQLKAYDSTATAFPELKEGTLLELVEGWLRVEKEERLASKMEVDGDSKNGGDDDNPLNDKGSAMDMPGWSNGYSAGRLTSSMKLSSNAVMRM
jgi:CCR4-NOT complex subunit CAF16